MEAREFFGVIDKSGWSTGPWSDEPDKMQWPDAATGLPCLIVRGPHGALCGYVGVSDAHPLHGKGYDDVPVGDDYEHSPHGGLTFARGCSHPTPEGWENYKKRLAKAKEEAKTYPRGDAAEFVREWGALLGSYDVWAERAQKRFICHTPGEGEPDNVWWFGFDCAHAGDHTPKYDRVIRDDLYRTVVYVRDECTALAAWLHTIASESA